MKRALAIVTNRGGRSRRVRTWWSKFHATVVLRTRGRLGGGWFGAPVLVLVTTGRRSGKVRETPLLYLREGDAYILVAANAGNDSPPQWWFNVRAAETVDIIVRGRRTTMRWREVPAGPDYDRLFGKLVEVYPPGAYYRGFTDRHLPVIALTA